MFKWWSTHSPIQQTGTTTTAKNKLVIIIKQFFPYKSRRNYSLICNLLFSSHRRQWRVAPRKIGTYIDLRMSCDLRTWRCSTIFVIPKTAAAATAADYYWISIMCLCFMEPNCLHRPLLVQLPPIELHLFGGWYTTKLRMSPFTQPSPNVVISIHFRQSINR